MSKFTLAILAALLIAPSFAHAQITSDEETVPYLPLPLKK